MPVPLAIPLAIGGAALIKGGMDYLSGRSQRKAAEKAQKETYRRGKIAAEGVRGAAQDAIGTLGTARQAAEGGYSQAREAYRAEQRTLGDRFSGERLAGEQALGRLSDLIMNADPTAGMERINVGQMLESDPEYQFAISEGNKALERAARASGGFGGGANLKDFIRFGQKSATQYTDKILDRERQRQQDIYSRQQDLIKNLSGLQNIGSRANAMEATLSSGLTGNIAQTFSNQGAASADILSEIARTGLAGETSAANLQMGYSQQAQPYQQQAVSGAGAGYRAAGQGISDTMRTIAYMYGTGGFGGGGGGGAETFEL